MDRLKLRTKLEKLTYPLCLIGAVLVTYSNVFSFAFLYDDEFAIQKNRFLDSFLNLPLIFQTSSTAGAGGVDSFFRPLQATCYLFLNQIFGREPWAFHAFNLWVHALAAILIFVLAHRLGLTRRFAFFAALLWALHPIQTEAVAYVSGLVEPLHVVFILAALLVMLPDFSGRKILKGLGLFVCALLSKESSVVFPALMTAVIFFFHEDDRTKLRTYLKTLPFWGVALLYMGLRHSVLNFNQDFSMYKEGNLYSENIIYRVWTFLATLPHYLEILVWPHDLHIDRNFPVYISPLNWDVIAGFLILAAALFCLVQALRGRKIFVWPAFMTLWFFGAMVPASGILIPLNSLFLEHWLYLPSICLFMGLSYLVQRKNKRWLYVIATLYCSWLAVSTHDQNWVWQSPVSLYSQILKYNPRADRVRHNLAMAYADEGRLTEALVQYQVVLQHTNSYPQTFHNMARIYQAQHRLDLAEEFEQQSIRVAPEFAPAYGGMAEVMSEKGDLPKAQEYKDKFEELTRQHMQGK